MKKKLISAGIICTFAIATVITVNMKQDKETVSDMMSANIEALAQGEGLGGYIGGYEASSYDIYVPPMWGYPGSLTTIPCCKPSTNRYNACLASLDKCKV